MSAKASFTYMDYSEEKSTVSLEGATLTVADFAVQEAAWSALGAAIGGVTLGTHIKSEMGNTLKYTNTPPVDAAAQRENKWLVTYEDDGNAGRMLQCELPCADLDSALMQPNTDLADLTAAAWVTFVTAFESIVKAPYSGNAVTVRRVQFVGRRL